MRIFIGVPREIQVVLLLPRCVLGSDVFDPDVVGQLDLHFQHCFALRDKGSAKHGARKGNA